MITFLFLFIVGLIGFTLKCILIYFVGCGLIGFYKALMDNKK